LRQTRSYSYDDQGRLTELANVHPTAGNLATYAYGYDWNHATSAYDRLGQRVTMTATVPAQSLSAAATEYSYDAAYQLTRTEYPAAPPFNGEAHMWTYDAIGNRMTSAVNGTTTTSYTYQKIGTNPNNWQRLLSAGSTSYTYDGNGNTSAEGTNSYAWDAENRLTSISGAVNATYTYDYQGRRTSKTVGGVTTTYLYDGLNLIAETTSTTTHSVFGPGIDEPLAVANAGAIAYLTTDGLGSVTIVNDAAGSVKNSYIYDAWGVSLSSSELVPQPFRYTARESGEVPAHYFYRARFYDAPVGRFLSEDPLRSFALSAYGYVENRPTFFTDPSGKVPVDYRGVRYDQMKKLCGAAGARGCAGFVGLQLKCTCRCVNGNQWQPMPWITVGGIRVYVSMDCTDPNDTFYEEQRHVDVMQRDLQRENDRAAKFRQTTFSSESACKLGCARWENSAAGNLANPIRHWFIDRTHWLSGSSKCQRQ
jgi:RHS repeat-associated protein